MDSPSPPAHPAARGTGLQKAEAINPLIVDGHLDLAWNMLTYGRDYLRSAREIREHENGSLTVEQNGDTLLGWPDFQRGRVAVVVATLFAAPQRWKTHENETQVYTTSDEAYRLYRNELDVYHKLCGEHPDKYRFIRSKAELDEHLVKWNTHSQLGNQEDDLSEKVLADKPIGLVISMEGGDGIRTPADLAEWHAQGVRLIGPAWVGTRYCGGWKEPGPLTEAGIELLKKMADFHFFLDLSHMDEQAVLQAIDLYQGPVIASHSNCLALLPGYPTNRQLTDQVIRGVLERDGMIGLVPYNIFLKVGWKRNENPREDVHLVNLVDHIDYVCQMAGDSLHAGIGSDFDGGFGKQSIPIELDTIADLQILVSLLSGRGYSETDVENILGRNWLSRFERELP